MYNRAKRNFDVNLGSTPQVVGPGRYELQDQRWSIFDQWLTILAKLGYTLVQIYQ